MTIDRLYSLITALCLVLIPATLVGCPPTSDDDDDSAEGTPSATPTAPQSALSVEITDLTFTHDVGATDCPQNIGTVTVTNSTDAEATVTTAITGEHAAMFQVDPYETTVPAGGSATMTVQFNCNWDGTQNISGSLEVVAGNGTKTNTQSAPITGTVNAGAIGR